MSNLINALSKTRFKIKQSLHTTFSKQATITDNDFSEIRKSLLDADCGTVCSNELVELLKNYCYKHSILKQSELAEALQQVAKSWLEPYANSWQAKPNIHETVLVFGVNGAGKTTTIAKIAHQLQTKNIKVSLAAGDTYRAAAIEQLTAWASKLDIPIIANNQGSDCASVVFDAIKTSQANGSNILLADTSGRLQNNNNLMQELAKVVRVCQKADPNAPQHRWLVLDATLGLNSIEQAKIFHEHLSVTGIIITKLDSSAKAGAIFAIVETIKAPILFVTTGEDISQLVEFKVEDFVSGLLN